MTRNYNTPHLQRSLYAPSTCAYFLKVLCDPLPPRPTALPIGSSTSGTGLPGPTLSIHLPCWGTSPSKECTVVTVITPLAHRATVCVSAHIGGPDSEEAERKVVLMCLGKNFGLTLVTAPWYTKTECCQASMRGLPCQAGNQN